ncbi:MAG TPA: Na+/H+ antiporter NhaC family protein [Bacillaceae bacterium]|nr:Na+/H+ antiporter NhaC family protein [Paenibacillus bovis]HLU20949.1 Na+/H+ antiporter NhaC family protein [Bacillaceae bacterium]
MENTIWSILPPILAIVMVILTKRVLLSLGTGIIASALLLGQGSIKNSAIYLWDAIKGIFIDDGSLNTWNIYIVLFLFILGVITVLINMVGGSRAFGEWAITKVKNRKGAQLLAAILGIIIFIDDYFNALAVGQVARPITDRHRISRAKLAYIIDSTSAPICVVSPISSWGAYIMGILATVFATHQITDMSVFTAFIQMIPMNLYVWTTLIFVFVIAILNVDFGSMKKHEEQTIATGIPYDENKTIPGEVQIDIPVSEKGRVRDLLWPIIALFIGTIGAIIWSGIQNSDEITLMNIFGNADVALSLVIGGIISLLVIIMLFFIQSKKYQTVQPKLLSTAFVSGVKSMMSAVLILFFAWALITLIDLLGTGVYLGSLVESSNLHVGFLPVILFIGAAVMAFATGTSWGAFGILLPIASQIIMVTDSSLLLPTLAAVLAGAVMGDHCSPISDTTILSSTGAGSNLMDHVMTQLPYAILTGLISAMGYIVIGFTNNTLLGLVTIAILLLCSVLILWKRKNLNTIG